MTAKRKIGKAPELAAPFIPVPLLPLIEQHIGYAELAYKAIGEACGVTYEEICRDAPEDNA